MPLHGSVQHTHTHTTKTFNRGTVRKRQGENMKTQKLHTVSLGVGTVIILFFLSLVHFLQPETPLTRVKKATDLF